MITPGEPPAGIESVPHPKAVLLDTPWAELSHAYGSAEDTPMLLVGLLDDDPEVQAHALGQLQMSVLHQGSIYSSTAPVALFVAGILDHPRTSAAHESEYPWDDRVRPLRAALLEWLGEIAESVGYYDDREQEPEYDDPADIAACRAARPAIHQAVAPYLADPDSVVREAAVGAAGHLLMTPELRDRIPDAAERLRTILTTSGDRRERAAAVLTLVARAQDTSDLLADQDPAIRACAALAPLPAEDPRPTAILLEALSDPRTADHWFDAEPLPQLDGWFRFTLLHALLARTTTLEEVLDAALALMPMANDFTVERDWGPLLLRAFPDGNASEAALTDAQYQLLSAIAAKDDCWGNIGNKITWLRRAGLPPERDSFRALLTSRDRASDF
ncbi:HEAT repeat domain-containing protein [Kitasatospora sp. NPDC048296]|uniref:HEAT repeat domain-containing protein n=1 Tax=Kitasatospora sp. NPDC048296 TaxID=3364048 RepID=UPI0037247123